MRLQIEPSEALWNVDGVAVRVWNGVNEDGRACLVLVHRVVVWQNDELPMQRIEMPHPTALRVVPEETLS